MTDDDPYGALGVPRTASTAEIRRAWRELAKTNHPDRFPGDEEKERRFKAAAAAWTLLSDPTARARFDRGQQTRSWTSAEHQAMQAEVQATKRAVEEVSVVLFDAILPVYIEAYDRGVSAELLWHLTHDLHARTLLDRVQASPRPGFGARQRAATIRQGLRLRLDSRVLHGPDGTPRVANLTRVTERGLQWSAITIWVGSLTALGLQANGHRLTLLLDGLTREVIRNLEADLPRNVRPLAERESTPIGTIPRDFRTFRNHDTRQIAVGGARVTAGFAVIVVLVWAIGWVLTGSATWRF